jgi:hypothetical protein
MSLVGLDRQNGGTEGGREGGRERGREGGREGRVNERIKLVRSEGARFESMGLV